MTTQEQAEQDADEYCAIIEALRRAEGYDTPMMIAFDLRLESLFGLKGNAKNRKRMRFRRKKMQKRVRGWGVPYTPIA